MKRCQNKSDILRQSPSGQSLSGLSTPQTKQRDDPPDDPPDDPSTPPDSDDAWDEDDEDGGFDTVTDIEEIEISLLSTFSSVRLLERKKTGGKKKTKSRKPSKHQ